MYIGTINCDNGPFSHCIFMLLISFTKIKALPIWSLSNLLFLYLHLLGTEKMSLDWFLGLNYLDTTNIF